MKNSVLRLTKSATFLSLLMAIAISSCSSENQDIRPLQNPTEHTAFEELSLSIEKKTDEFFAMHSPDSGSRKSFWSRLFHVVWSDVSTTAIAFFTSFDFKDSAEKGGAASVQTALKEIHDVLTSNSPIANLTCTSDKINNLLKESLTMLNKQSYELGDKNIGLWHNAIVLTMITDGISVKDDLNAISLAAANSSKKLSKSSGLDCNYSTSDYGKLIYNTTNSFFETIYDEDPTIICDNIARKYTSYSNEMNIIKTFYLKLIYCHNLEEIDKLTDLYIYEVDKSNISEKSKTIINIQLSVAKNSSILWDMVYNDINTLKLSN